MVLQGVGAGPRGAASWAAAAAAAVAAAGVRRQAGRGRRAAARWAAGAERSVPRLAGVASPSCGKGGLNQLAAGWRRLGRGCTCYTSTQSAGDESAGGAAEGWPHAGWQQMRCPRAPPLPSPPALPMMQESVAITVEGSPAARMPTGGRGTSGCASLEGAGRCAAGGDAAAQQR